MKHTEPKPWKYLGFNVYPTSLNSSGIRWYALTWNNGSAVYLKADTKAGMRELIRKESR